MEVSVARQALVYPELARLGDLDNAVVTIRFAGGGLAVTHVSRTSSYGHVIRCEVVGDRGLGFVRAGDEAGAGGRPRCSPQASRLDYRDRFADAYVAELTAFVRACFGRTARPAPTLESDRRAVATGVAARASAVEGGPLEVGTDWAWAGHPSGD